MTVIRNSRHLDDLREDLSGEFIHTHFKEERDPRSLSFSPSVVFFKGKTNRPSKICALFPDSMDQTLLKEVFTHVTRRPIVTRSMKLARAFFKRIGVKASFLDFSGTAVKHLGGRSDVAVCDFVWNHKFCPIASWEWMVDPLTELQEYHMVYLMELTEAAVIKMGLNNFRTTE